MKRNNKYVEIALKIYLKDFKTNSQSQVEIKALKKAKKKIVDHYLLIQIHPLISNLSLYLLDNNNNKLILAIQT